MNMKKYALVATIATIVGLVLGRLVPVQSQAQLKPATSWAAVPGEKGGEDVWGPYQVQIGWPQDLNALPGHDPKWSWGSVEGIFAESPDRVYILQRGELPYMPKRPVNTPIPQFAPSLSYPTNEVPFRNASQGPVAAMPGEGENYKGKEGVDARWEHCLVVVNRQGKIIEEWTQWDKTFKRPHAVYVNPYDPDKAVWVVDDGRHAIFKFSHDGKKLLLTIGTPDVQGSDATHYGRPTFLAWLPDSTMFLSDGYTNTRVVKFDKNGKYLLAWGEKGTPPKTPMDPGDTRPGYFNTVHGVAVDPVTRRVYVNDRANRRCQVFDENGKFLDQWSYGPIAQVYSLYMGVDRKLWAPDSRTWKLLKYDLEGHFLYGWGSLIDLPNPGGMFGVHEISVDQEGDLYFAEVSMGRAQKFVPRKGAQPEMLVSPPPKGAW